jgi:hypothetical protein
MQIKASKDGMEAAVDFKVGENLEEAVKLFGEEVIFHKLKQQIAKDAQAVIRAHLVAGKDEPQIKEYFKTWKPALGPSKKDPVDKLLDIFGKLDPEAKAAALKQIKESRG